MWSFFKNQKTSQAKHAFSFFKGENSVQVDSCGQFWIQRYLQGWKSASGLRACAGFSKEQVLAAFHWRLLDYANHSVPF